MVRISECAISGTLVGFLPFDKNLFAKLSSTARQKSSTQQYSSVISFFMGNLLLLLKYSSLPCSPLLSSTFIYFLIHNWGSKYFLSLDTWVRIKGLNNGSCINREVSVQFCERLVGKFRRSTLLVVLHDNEEIVFKAKILTERWLKTIGLELKPSKTRISHTLKSLNERPGFDFLGFTVRQFPVKQSRQGYKLSIKPSHDSIKQHALVIKNKLRKMRGAPQE